jgi:hypothetical protein
VRQEFLTVSMASASAASQTSDAAHGAPDACTSDVTSAIAIHAVTSSKAAQAMATVPRGVPAR